MQFLFVKNQDGTNAIMTLPGFFEGTSMADSRWWEALFPDPADVIASVGPPHGSLAVDLCSGDGWFTSHMACRARSVVAIDIDAEVLKTNRARLDDLGITNCKFVAGNAYDLPKMVSEPVDFVFMANAFHGVPDQPKLVNAVHATLRPGGLFTVVNWHQKPREQTTIFGEPRGPKSELRMSPAQTIESVLPCGFSLTKSVEILPYHYGVVFRKSVT